MWQRLSALIGVEPNRQPPYRMAMLRFSTLSAIALLLAAPIFAQPAGFYNPDEKMATRPLEEVAASGAQVITSADPDATKAGQAILAQGGNAIDAALATMIALTVAEPQSSGIGGGAFLSYYDAKARQTFTIDGRERAPQAATAKLFLRPDGTAMNYGEAVPGGYSVGVPGVVSLAAAAHRRWGSVRWASLFTPAIALAEKGVPVTQRMHRFIQSRRAMLRRDPAAAALFLDSQGEPWPVGHVLRQPELAQTLRTIAQGGPEAFYTGSIAADISAAVEGAFQHPTKLSADDLARYQATARPPLCRPYRQVQVCTMGPPSSGGVAVIQILAQLERFDLQALGADNLLSWHLIAESQRLAYADREAFGADTDFVPVPVDGLLDPQYLASRSALIRQERAMDAVQAGTPPGAPPRVAQGLADVPGTSHLAAADAAGNVANITSTIEGPFGSGLMAAGFMLNNEMTDFDFQPLRADGTPAPNRVQPMKRPRSSMAPTILLDRRGRAIAAFGAAGGATIIAQVAKAIIAHVDWDMPVEAAIAAPQLVADGRGVRLEAGSRLEQMAAGLQALGHRNVTSASLPLKGNGLSRDGDGWRAAGDYRSEGSALSAPARKGK